MEEFRVDRKPEKPRDPQEELLEILKKRVSMQCISDRMCMSERVILAIIDDLRESGYQIEANNGEYYLCKTVIPADNCFDTDWRGDKIIRFGVVSDTHLCNKCQQLTHLNDIYDIFSREGIDTVYHSGDIVDGFYKNRPGHIYELFHIGADEQANYAISRYPRRPGIKTKFITGNHDHTHILNGGTNIGIMISKDRDDLEYLGMGNARIFLTPNCILELNHPEDGASYALSYALQKTIDAMSGGEKPNIFFNGHHHKGLYMPTYRNIHSFECATFEAQTPWMKGKKLAAHVGGWIITTHVDDEGTIRRCIIEFFPYYKHDKNDYLNWQ